jgi:hypothetical protein
MKTIRAVDLLQPRARALSGILRCVLAGGRRSATALPECWTVTLSGQNSIPTRVQHHGSGPIQALEG